MVKIQWPDKDHVFVYDIATTHIKQPEGSLSAIRMTQGPSANFGVSMNVPGPDGKPLYSLNGKLMKQNIQMKKGNLKDGTDQDFWYKDNHKNHSDMFKGMMKILAEHGYLLAEIEKRKAQCTVIPLSQHVLKEQLIAAFVNCLLMSPIFPVLHQS